jgi:hypothetical protein
MTRPQNGSPARPASPAAAHGAVAAPRPTPTPRPQPTIALCPYCGHASPNTQQCDRCKGLFDPLSRQASQNAMGPWYIRDDSNPFRPGCSYDTLKSLIVRGRVTRVSVLRGPTTRQFWTMARSTPGIAHLLGECHSCHAAARPDDPACGSCGASFVYENDRQALGLAPVHLLPGHASPENIAASVLGRATAAHAPTAPLRSTPASFAAPRLPQSTPITPTETPEPSARPRSIAPIAGLVLLCILLGGALAAVIVLPMVGVPLPWSPQASELSPKPIAAPAPTNDSASDQVSPASARSPEGDPGVDGVPKPAKDGSDSKSPNAPEPAPSPTPPPSNEGAGSGGSVLIRVPPSAPSDARILSVSGSISDAERTYAARRLEQLRITRYLPRP